MINFYDIDISLENQVNNIDLLQLIKTLQLMKHLYTQISHLLRRWKQTIECGVHIFTHYGYILNRVATLYRVGNRVYNGGTDYRVEQQSRGLILSLK